MAETLTPREANDAVPGWRALASGLHITVATDDFAAALALVDRIGAIAEEQQHHPDLDLRWGRVHVVTSSHDVGGISDRDVRLATAVNEVLAEMGLEPETTRVAELEIAIDAMDIPAVRPFWAAVLGYDDGRGQTLVDPESVRPRSGSSRWTNRDRSATGSTSTSGSRPRRPKPRIARAIEAGGRLVSDIGGAVVLGARRPRGQRGLHLHRRAARVTRPPLGSTVSRATRLTAYSEPSGSTRSRAGRDSRPVGERVVLVRDDPPAAFLAQPDGQS